MAVAFQIEYMRLIRFCLVLVVNDTTEGGKGKK
jgi:hypothetical protein